MSEILKTNNGYYIQKSNVNIIEASSFQLNYSKFIKPIHAAILNLIKDHLDWHKDFKNYTNSKLKIFPNRIKKIMPFYGIKNLLNYLKIKNFMVIKNYQPFKFNRVKIKLKIFIYFQNK